MPGDGGMAKPRRGTRVPLLLRLPPGIGGRRRGAGEDIRAARTRQMSKISTVDHELYQADVFETSDTKEIRTG